MRQKVQQWAAAASRSITRATWLLSGLGLVVMIGLITVQIAGRYLFQAGPHWTEEAARYAMVWSGLLGAVAAASTGADPAVTRIGAGHSVGRRRLRHWATAISTAVFLLPVLAFSPGFIERAGLRTSEALEWNLGLVVLIVPLYAALVLAQSMLRLIAFEADPARVDLDGLEENNAREGGTPR